MMSSRFRRRWCRALTSAEKSLAGGAGRGLGAALALGAAARARPLALEAAFFATGRDSFLVVFLTALAALRCPFFMAQNSSLDIEMSTRDIKISTRGAALSGGGVFAGTARRGGKTHRHMLDAGVRVGTQALDRRAQLHVAHPPRHFFNH